VVIRQLRLRFLILLVAASLVLPIANAQNRAPTDEQRREAKRHFDKGQLAYDLGRYTEAIAEWERSYALSREPGLLYNLGQAAQLHGDCAAAARYYMSFLRRRPNASNREQVEGLIEEMTICVAAKPPSPADEQSPEQPGTPLREMKPASPPPAPAAEALREPAPVAIEAKPRPGRTKKVAGIAAAGGGALLIGTGIYFGRRASSASDEVTEACGTGCEWADESGTDADGRRAAKLQWAFYGVGAAALASGAVLYYLGLRDDRQAAQVMAGPLRNGGAGAVVSWAWWRQR
jgi:tetratricopeptide (TPR) repeat protein